jgi:hypothetical protein
MPGHRFADLQGKRVNVSIGIAKMSVPGLNSADKPVQEVGNAMYKSPVKGGRNMIETAVSAIGLHNSVVDIL